MFMFKRLICAWSLLMIAQVDTARARLQLSGHGAESVSSWQYLQSISQSFCQNISNFVPKFASSLRSSKFILKITNRFFKQSIWLDYFNSWANRGFVYKLAFKFQYELLNFATNLRIFWQKFCEIDCNVDYKLVNLQFNVFKTTSTGVRCVYIALFLKRFWSGGSG